MQGECYLSPSRFMQALSPGCAGSSLASSGAETMCSCPLMTQPFSWSRWRSSTCMATPQSSASMPQCRAMAASEVCAAAHCAADSCTMLHIARVGPAVEVNRKPYGWRSLEMLEVTMDQGWHYDPSWPGLPKEVSCGRSNAQARMQPMAADGSRRRNLLQAHALTIHTPLFTLWLWGTPGGRLPSHKRFYRPTLSLRLQPDPSQPHITSVRQILLAR